MSKKAASEWLEKVANLAFLDAQRSRRAVPSDSYSGCGQQPMDPPLQHRGIVKAEQGIITEEQDRRRGRQFVERRALLLISGFAVLAVSRQ
jgi:hypothetical protein